MIENPAILLVDDEKDVLNSFKFWLEDEGFLVHTATSRKEAIKVLEEFPVALCLIDLKLKDEDGLQLSRELKRIDALLKIIILTAYPSYNTAIDAMKLGIFDYISKSMDHKAILDKVHDALNARQDEIVAKTGLSEREKKIILVCHHMMIREGFENFCREENDYSLVHTYHSVDYIKNSDFNNQAALVLLCVTCNQDKLEKPRATFSRLNLFFPNARFVLMNSQYDNEEKMELITLGVKGFLPKNINKENMKRAFKAILGGEMWVSRKLTDALLSRLIRQTTGRRYEKPQNSYRLSRREVEILQAMASGLSNFEISDKLYISEKTVKAHINHIFKKMRVKSRTQAVMKAMESHII